MSRKSAGIRKEAQVALDAISGCEPILLKNVGLPPPGAAVLPRSRRHAADTTNPEPTAAAPAQAPAFEPFPEVVYDEAARRNIQGNIIPGFNKDHQHFFFYRITDVLLAKKFLRVLAPSISSMAEVLEFVRAHRALRLK